MAFYHRIRCPKCSAAKFLDESNDVDELQLELFARKALGRDADETRPTQSSNTTRTSLFGEL